MDPLLDQREVLLLFRRERIAPAVVRLVKPQQRVGEGVAHTEAGK